MHASEEQGVWKPGRRAGGASTRRVLEWSTAIFISFALPPPPPTPRRHTGILLSHPASLLIDAFLLRLCAFGVVLFLLHGFQQFFNNAGEPGASRNNRDVFRA